MSEERVNHLVGFGETSRLKIDLNKGIADLSKAKEGHYQPHLCLNGKDGLKTIKQIATNPEAADTSYLISTKRIIDGRDIWLNINFFVLLKVNTGPGDRYSTPTVSLTPRQTAHIVKNMPTESQKIVFEKVKRWYLEKFVSEIQEGLQTIAKQFEKEEFLLESDSENRIFDIHGKRSLDVPYTEWSIVGDELFGPLFFGVTFLDHGQDGYGKIDSFLEEIDRTRKSAVDGFLGLTKALDLR